MAESTTPPDARAAFERALDTLRHEAYASGVRMGMYGYESELHLVPGAYAEVLRLYDARPAAPGAEYAFGRDEIRHLMIYRQLSSEARAQLAKHSRRISSPVRPSRPRRQERNRELR